MSVFERSGYLLQSASVLFPYFGILGRARYTLGYFGLGMCVVETVVCSAETIDRWTDI